MTVYISLDKGVDPSYKSEVLTALYDWSSVLKTKSGNSAVFNFLVLDTPQSKKIPADTSIKIRKNTGSVLGSTQPSASGETLTYCKIVMASQNAMGLTLD